VLSVEKLGRREGRLQILQDVSFGWDRGVLAVDRGNGTGQTTLLRVVAGAAKPQRGKSHMTAFPRLGAVRYRGVVGYGPQERNLDLAITLREFLGLCADLRGMRGRSAKIAAVAKNSDSPNNSMNTSPICRAAAAQGDDAQAMLGASELIVLDEPTSEVTTPPAAASGQRFRRGKIQRAGDRDPRCGIGR